MAAVALVAACSGEGDPSGDADPDAAADDGDGNASDPVSGDVAGDIPVPSASWQVLAEELPAALLSVWGSSASDVWTVGGDTRDGSGPWVLHWDGVDWSRLETGATGALWWVTGDGAGSIWMAGDGGLVLRYVEASGQFESFETPGDDLLFGVFPLAPNDVWTVGGLAAERNAVAWHFDGSTWSDVAIPAEADTAPLFKVWGRSGDDVTFVGLGGSALHWDGAAFTATPIPGARRLFTLHGDADEIWAVGGFQQGWMLRELGGVWEERTPPGEVPQLNGVYVAPDGDAWAVGIMGAVWRLHDSVWAPVEGAPQTPLDLHSVYVDPDGGVWASGGFVVSNPLSRGMLHYFGPPAVPVAVE